MRNFADFAALPTASGLVITPFADDLDVSVNATRVTISRPSGLVLTPPQMPVGQTPSALARFGDGPSYLDFDHWRQASAGSFLATQRELIQSAVHAYPQNAAAGANAIIQDPLLVDPSNADFHLRAGSPAIDAAKTTATDPMVDFDGTVRPQGARDDIGAFEFKP